MRIVSLLPAATEIVACLGLLDHLVGVSHECDWPDPVRKLPRITHCPIHGGNLDSGVVDRWVSRTLEEQGTLYRLDEAKMRELGPGLILTQRLCDVCAVDYGSVAAFAGTLPGPPTVVNLEPNTLEEIFGDIRRVAAAAGEPGRAEPVLEALRARVEKVRRDAAAAGSRPRTCLLEWVDPPFAAGHWGPELVDLAGGVELLGRVGEESVRVTWEAVRAAAPEVLVLACCGYTAARTLEDVPRLRALPGWDDLPAVRSGRIHAVDANAHFSRPGPRTVDSLEILAEILHPEVFAGRFPDRGAVRVEP